MELGNIISNVLPKVLKNPWSASWDTAKNQMVANAKN